MGTSAIFRCSFDAITSISEANSIPPVFNGSRSSASRVIARNPLWVSEKWVWKMKLIIHGQERVADVPVERGHRTCVDGSLKPGTDDEIRAVPERCDQARDLAKIIGIVCIAYDNIPAPCLFKPGEIRVAVPALFRPDRPARQELLRSPVSCPMKRRQQ